MLFRSYTGPLETAPTVSATYGMGGNNQPFVAEPDTPKTMKVRAGKSGGGKGILVQEDKSATKPLEGAVTTV